MPVNSVRTVVEILDRSLNKVAEVKNLYPINNKGMILNYVKELSNYGKCIFRISTRDPMFTQFGDIIIPHKYHVRIKRANVTVWQGTIVDNKHRNRNYQEIIAYEYLYYLDKVLVKRTSAARSGEAVNYRIFNSGSMSSAVSTILTEAVATFGSNHIMNNLTQGTIDNPNFPPGLVDGNGLALTGAWAFSTNLQLQFDYNSVLFVIQAFANYGKCDFKIDTNLAFQFRDFLGNKQTNLTFSYGRSGTKGNIIDYDIPRLGGRMANDLIGIAVDSQGKVLFNSKTDEASKQEYGLLQMALPFVDAKDQNSLNTRVDDQLRFVKSPVNSPLDFVLDETGYPLGQYDIGDIVTASIIDNVINYNAPRRVVRISVDVHNTGREIITVRTNEPREEDLGN